MLSICVSPAVCLQIFWMGVSVASAPPQTLPPRWKGCRPPPVTLPSRRFRTSPLSDPLSITDIAGGLGRFSGPSPLILLWLPMPSQNGFRSFPELSCYVTFKARRESFLCGTDSKGMERLWMFFASAAINRCKTWCIDLYQSEGHHRGGLWILYVLFPNGAIIFLITLRKENRCKRENNYRHVL